MRRTAPELIVDLVGRHADISAICLFRPTFSPPIQENTRLIPAETRLITDALALRTQTGFSFWDCLLQLVSLSNLDTPTLLETVRRHNPQLPTTERIPRREVTKDILASKISELKQDEMLAISSRMECSAEIMHVPMLDFHCKASLSNDRRVKHVIQALDLRGHILHSGESYHFYGSHLVNTETLVTMLGRALLFAPIIDRSWIAHQLIERACGLRISPGKIYPESPVVIDEV